jgi:phosphoribosyl-ATP pyrophosphohydrolase
MYRENIYKFLGNGKKVLLIPKNGGLKQYVRKILPDIGIDCEREIKKIERGEKDSVTAKKDLEILLARGEDIPRKVKELAQTGKQAYGLTGDDLFDEFSAFFGKDFSGVALLNTYDWFDEKAEYGRPALCLMSTTGNWEGIPKKAECAVNLKYRMQSQLFLEDISKQKGKAIHANPYAGDTELTVAERINDCCVDIVYGGETRKKNNLQVVEIVRFSDIALIGPDVPRNIWEHEYNRISIRKAKPTASYTSKLLCNENEIVKKFGQESAEFIQAYCKKKEVKPEALDVLYAIMAALISQDISWREMEKELERRWTKTAT